MLSIQQLIKALRQLQNNSNAMTATATTAAAVASSATGGGAGDLLKCLKHVVDVKTNTTTQKTAETTTPAAMACWASNDVTSSIAIRSLSFVGAAIALPKQQQQQQQQQNASNSSQRDVGCEISDANNEGSKHERQQRTRTTPQSTHCSVGRKISLDSCVQVNGCSTPVAAVKVPVDETEESQQQQQQQQQQQYTVYASNKSGEHIQTAEHSIAPTTITSSSSSSSSSRSIAYLQRSQQIHNFYLQQLQHFHTAQQQANFPSKQKQTQFAMSSLAAEPLVLKQEEIVTNGLNGGSGGNNDGTANGSSKSPAGNNCSSSSSASKPCFSTGLGEILQFMELIGNLKHTKRTGWVLRDVNDCESISGHMYRMSMMTFLLDGSEGLNQIRCMELALVHDLAESLVGDITPFCGVSKTEKRAMEFKAMADICKLIEPRGKRIMELFEEYEEGESAESKFVKDLDRLDMVMQAFEYEKRDNCLLKHQEFFDSTEGKFNHPFVKKLVEEIYEQRRSLAKDKGATPPPPVQVPSMEEPQNTTSEPLKQKTSTSS